MLEIVRIIERLKLLASPAKFFWEKYGVCGLHGVYYNYLYFVYAQFFEDSRYPNFKEKPGEGFELTAVTEEKIIQLNQNLVFFFTKHQLSNDFELLRDPYWKKISKEALSCINAIAQEKKITRLIEVSLDHHLSSGENQDKKKESTFWYRLFGSKK